MKMTVKIEREEAEKLLGEYVMKQFFEGCKDLRVEDVSWDTYRTRVEIEITDEPENKIAPAPEAVAA